MNIKVIFKFLPMSRLLRVLSHEFNLANEETDADRFLLQNDLVSVLNRFLYELKLIRLLKFNVE